jgi:hypothetical protein
LQQPSDQVIDPATKAAMEFYNRGSLPASLSEMGTRNAFEWIMYAGRQPPPMYDRIIINQPSGYFSQIQEPLASFENDDHDDNFVAGHHFVQFSTSHQHMDDDTVEHDTDVTSVKPIVGQHEQITKKIPYPTSKWDKSTPMILGMTGLFGSGFIIVIFMIVAIIVNRCMDFELGVSEAEMCPLREPLTCVKTDLPEEKPECKRMMSSSALRSSSQKSLIKF